MNWKKLLLILIVLASFLGTGALLSNIQSREADQLLEAHGMSNNTRYLYLKRNEKIRTFLIYLEHNFKHHHVQLHLDSRQQPGQILVWANYNAPGLDTEEGRYFALDDFSGCVSFAVTGPDPYVPQLNTQGNTYLHLNQRYYSVIGKLKDYQKVEQHKYYISTGVDQPTAQASLRHYRLIIDAASPTIQKISQHYHALVALPSFVKNHQIQRFSVIKEIMLILLLWFVAAGANILLMLMEWRQIQQTHLKGSLLHNWLLNRSCRLVLIEGVLGVLAYAFLRGHAFFRRTDHLAELIFLSWLFAVGTYLLLAYHLWRKEKELA